MPRRKKIVALPAQAGKDIKTVTGILDKWAIGAEDLLKEVFAWGKRHKLLVIVVIGLIAMKRYWLDDEPEPEDDF